ncbi:hypothetical protein DB347_25120 [Opitutaceae bacterium EW11]|nr:hypothetical protein DB347_25120 [Opitutaceae bacterium EW11]
MKTPFKVSFADYSCAYHVKGFTPVHALRGLTIPEIQNGEIVFVVGPNGSGKTTFLDAVCGRIRPDQGWIRWDPASSGSAVNLRLCYVPQMPSSGIVGDLSILENLLLRDSLGSGPRLSRAVTQERRRSAESFLKEFGCEWLISRFDLPPACLSGGQQQILNLVSVLFADPPIAILDEPTSKLDEAHRVILMNLLVRASREKGTAVLCATHDVDMVTRIADRVFPLRDGLPQEPERRRDVGDVRSPGAVRISQSAIDLPVAVQGVEPDWWAPGPNRLFGEAYQRGDDSHEGYLARHELSRDARTRREIAGIQRILGIVGTSHLNIADVPCGWGRHSLALAKEGFNVTGVDVNPTYVQQASDEAKRLSLPAKFVVADMRNTGLPADSQDGIVNMWTSFGFFDHEENMNVLREFSRVLRSGGKILIHSDLNPRRVHYGIFDEPSERHLKDHKTLAVVEHYCDSEHAIYGSWAVDGFPPFRYRIAVYREDQWRMMAGKVGLRVDAFYGSFDGDLDLSVRSQEFIVVMSKPVP